MEVQYPSYYTTLEVCKILKISRRLFYQLVKDGQLKAHGIGVGKIRKKEWRVYKEDLEDFIRK